MMPHRPFVSHTTPPSAARAPVRTAPQWAAALAALALGALMACAPPAGDEAGAPAPQSGTWHVTLAQGEGAGCGSHGGRLTLGLHGTADALAGRVLAAAHLRFGPQSSVAGGAGSGQLAVNVNDYDSADGLLLVGRKTGESYAGHYAYRGEGCPMTERGTFRMVR